MSTTQHFRSALVLAATLALGACATPYYGADQERDYPPAAYSRDLRSGYGTVQAIDQLRNENSGSSIGIGTVAGAVVGGLLGHQVGDGKGNTAATVIGVAGGALIGHEFDKRNQAQREGYRLTIRMEDGSYQSIEQNADFVDLRVGDRVRIDNGNVRRY
jgi:outer membrane lipoprotein SlyB